MTFYCILLFLESSTEWSCRRSMALRGVRGGGLESGSSGSSSGSGSNLAECYLLLFVLHMAARPLLFLRLWFLRERGEGRGAIQLSCAGCSIYLRLSADYILDSSLLEPILLDIDKPNSLLFLRAEALACWHVACGA